MQAIELSQRTAPSHVRKLSVSLVATAISSVSLYPGITLAADNAEQSPTVGGLDTVTVTARKRTENIQNIPVAVTALTKEQIERYDYSNLEKVAQSTPALTVGRSSFGSGGQISLRGIGSNFTSAGIEQSVAVIVDGVYYGHGHFLDEGFFDLSQIEVLKGPQALFYGKNATAGVISITTNNPKDHFESMVRTSYEVGSERLLGEAMVSGPVSDKLSLRLALRATDMSSGYFTNAAQPSNYRTTDIVTRAVHNHALTPGQVDEPREKQVIARVSAKWTPNDQLTTTLKAAIDSDKDNNNGWNVVLFGCPSGSSALSARDTCGRHFVIYDVNMPADIAANFPHANGGKLYNDYNSWSATDNITYELPKVSLTSIANYNSWGNSLLSDATNSDSSTIGTFFTQDSKAHNISEELRALTTFDGPLNILTGVYYQNTYYKYELWTVQAHAEDSSQSPENVFKGTQKYSTTDGETISGYGQVIWKALSNVEVTAGARYIHETKNSFFVQPYIFKPLAAAGTFVPNVPITANQVFNNWSPEATVTWKPEENLTTYVAFKTGYKAGGFSNSGIFNTKTLLSDFAFGPEKASGFEGGVKATVLDDQLRIDADAYYYKYSDLQVDFFNSPTFAFQTENAGSEKVKGGEIQLDYAPRAVRGLVLHGSVNYNDARYADFLAPCYAGQTPAMGCNIVGPAPKLTPEQNLGGVHTAMAPEWTGSLGVDYSRGLTDRYVFTISTNARYSSSYMASPFAEPLSRQPQYTNLDASLQLATADNRWQVAVIGRNLTNQFVVTGSVDSPNTGSGTGTATGRLADQAGLAALPRAVQVQATWRY